MPATKSKSSSTSKAVNPQLNDLVLWCNTHVQAFKNLEKSDEECCLNEHKSFGDINVSVSRTWFSLVISVQSTGDALLRQGFVSSMVERINNTVVTPDCCVYVETALSNGRMYLR